MYKVKILCGLFLIGLLTLKSEAFRSTDASMELMAGELEEELEEYGTDYSQELIEVEDGQYEDGDGSTNQDELENLSSDEDAYLDEDDNATKIHLNKDGRYRQFCVTEQCFIKRKACFEGCKPRDGSCGSNCFFRYGGAKPKSRNCTGNLRTCLFECFKECGKKHKNPINKVPCTNQCNAWKIFATYRQDYGIPGPY